MMKARSIAVTFLFFLMTQSGVFGAEQQQFTLTTLDGRVIDSASLLGSPVVIVVGADW